MLGLIKGFLKSSFFSKPSLVMWIRWGTICLLQKPPKWASSTNQGCPSAARLWANPQLQAGKWLNLSKPELKLHVLLEMVDLRLTVKQTLHVLISESHCTLEVQFTVLFWTMLSAP